MLVGSWLKFRSVWTLLTWRAQAHKTRPTFKCQWQPVGWYASGQLWALTYPSSLFASCLTDSGSSLSYLYVETDIKDYWQLAGCTGQCFQWRVCSLPVPQELLHVIRRYPSEVERLYPHKSLWRFHYLGTTISLTVIGQLTPQFFSSQEVRSGAKNDNSLSSLLVAMVTSPIMCDCTKTLRSFLPWSYSDVRSSVSGIWGKHQMLQQNVFLVFLPAGF